MEQNSCLQCTRNYMVTWTSIGGILKIFFLTLLYAYCSSLTLFSFLFCQIMLVILHSILCVYWTGCPALQQNLYLELHSRHLPVLCSLIITTRKLHQLVFKLECDMRQWIVRKPKLLEIHFHIILCGMYPGETDHMFWSMSPRFKCCKCDNVVKAKMFFKCNIKRLSFCRDHYCGIVLLLCVCFHSKNTLTCKPIYFGFCYLSNFMCSFWSVFICLVNHELAVTGKILSFLKASPAKKVTSFWFGNVFFRKRVPVTYRFGISVQEMIKLYLHFIKFRDMYGIMNYGMLVLSYIIEVWHSGSYPVGAGIKYWDVAD